MKFHAIEHMVEDMLLYGTPSEFDTGSNESHHKASKYAAKLTQRKESTFNFQTAMRMTEFLVLDLALCETQQNKCLWEYFGADVEAPMDQVLAQFEQLMEEHDLSQQLDLNRWDDEDGEFDDDVSFRDLNLPESGSEDEEEEEEEEPKKQQPQEEELEQAADELEATETVVVTGGTRMRMDRNKKDDSTSFTMLTRSTKMKETRKWNPEVVEFLHGLQDLVVQYIPTDWLPVFTMQKRNETTFHGHPNYRNGGPWRDWVSIDWGADYGVLPAQIWCFVRFRDLPRGPNKREKHKERLNHGDCELRDGVFAVIESGTWMSEGPTKHQEIHAVPET